MVISFPRVCTTVDAADLNLDDFPYKYYYEISPNDSYINNYNYIVAISTHSLVDISHSGSYSYYALDLNTRLKYTISRSTSHKYFGISASNSANVYILTYSSINGWELHLPWIMYGNESYIITWDITKSQFSNTVPTGMPEININNIDDSIQNVLNGTTQTTTEAQNLQAGLATDYSSYQNGDISSQTLQVSVDNTVNSLNTLNNNTGNTLADLIAVQNGLTYAQTVQDKINADEIIATQTVTPSVQTSINGYVTQANNAYSKFIEGSITQSYAISYIQKQIIRLNDMIGNQATKAADIAAVNAAINTVQNTSNSVHNYKELDKKISKKAQQSDSDELNYINNLQNETTSQLQDFAPSQKMNSQQQTEVKNNLLNLIWDNELIKMILPLAGACMIICVTLGIKYKL